MSAIPTIVGYALREALRRKVFAVVLLLTAGFLFLYWLANHYLFRDVNNLGSPSPGIEPRIFAGAFMVGLAMKQDARLRSEEKKKRVAFARSRRKSAW